MNIPRELVRGAAETIRETLPSDEREAGVFLAGMAWAFVLFWTIVAVTTWLFYLGYGRPG